MSEESAVSNEKYDNLGLKPDFIWYLLAFVIGLGLRLVSLGAMTFTQNELVLVNQALHISQQASAATSTVPIYTGLTGGLFFLFGAGNALGRIVPAVVGASLVLLPWLWKEQPGQRAALIMSFALALDPTHLVFSRAIHGGIFAVAGLLWAFTLLKKDRPLLAGVSLVFAFLSGATFWNFLLFFGLGFAITTIIKPYLAKELVTFHFRNGKRALLSFASGFFVFAFFILTSFLLQPSGLGGVASGLVTFIRNFSQPYEKPIYHSIYLLIAYSLLPLLVFFIGYFKSCNSEKGDWYQLAGVSILISLLVGFLVSRESFELLLVPVSICLTGGVFWLEKYDFNLTKPSLLTGLLMAFVLSILTYLSMNISRISQLPLGTPQFWLVFLMIAAGVILLVLAWRMVNFGWLTENGNQAFLLTLLTFLAIISVGHGTRGLISDQQVRSLQYLDNQVVLPNGDIDSILVDFSLTGKTLQQWGDYNLLDLPEEYSWYFRSFAIERNQTETSMILSRTSTLPPQNDQFRGRNVVLERTIDWYKEPLTTYLKALNGKTKPFVDQKGVLWVRTFLFTGASQ